MQVYRDDASQNLNAFNIYQAHSGKFRYVKMNEGDEFNSFEEFQDKLLQWSATTNVIWVKSHSKTVQSANKKLSSKSKAFDQKFKFRNVLYRCKHGGAPRRSGRGLRPNQSSFKQECKARLFLSINKDKTKLVVQTLITAHNHEVSKDAFKHYPEQRRLSEVKKREVETMLQLGVKVKYLKEHVEKQQNQIITLKDLHNIHQKAKRERTGEKSEEELLMDELHQLCEDDPDAVISVQTNSEGVLEFLLLVTGDMKQTFAMFPEVLMIDCTYCTNRLRMPLFTLLVEDGNGSGQTVGYAFITNETENTLSAVMTEMSRIHKLSKVKVVVLDKDMKEIAAVKKVIPGADVQLCKFHVIQAVDRFINKLTIPQETKVDLKKSFQALVFSKSKSAFDRSLGHLAATAPENFMAYYNKNWGKQHQIQHWAYYKTIKQINLGNTTNNRIESHNQKIKDVLKRNMTLPEAVKNIILLHTGRVHEMAHREFNHTFKTAYRLGDDDVVKDDIVKQITPYAAGIIIAELEKARFSTSKNNKICTCPLKTTMLLPCRHIFANRIEQGESLFHIQDVGERWHLAFQKKIWTNRKRPRTTSPENKLSLRKRFKKNPSTKTQKFKEIMVLCKAMADFASSLGTSDFNEKMDTLTKMYDAWLSGGKVIFTTGEVDLDEPYPFVKTPETPVMSPSPTSKNNMVPSPCSSESTMYKGLVFTITPISSCISTST
ncbi:uncharacterized protein LOC133204337 [Saccostrea echinata]|uniref:uncharacterized protein LOC133204337 n=1 Tax=Saccostrea echinata TaxID=191078 RepID=UPI002A8301CA|nr:uncharacterized protein LOC133204337 [Saccostrea echinata]